MLDKIWALYRAPLYKFWTIGGRSTRREYWTFALVNFAVALVLSWLDSLLGLTSQTLEIGLLGGVFGLALFIPSLTVEARRLHDSNLSAWWMLITLLPLFGWLINLHQLLKSGTSGENRFGPDPREAVPATVTEVPA